MEKKPFRAKQISEWLWSHGAGRFEDMSNLSKSLRTTLEDAFSLERVSLTESQTSTDGTVKCAFAIDGNEARVVEGVDSDDQAVDRLHQFPGRVQFGVQVLRHGQIEVAQELDGG